ncbi:cupin domain-containing protein [Wenyingzhuangia sp. chi5]|uniref:Cupin domain-containing protein n=1 Tax=Wenyingzhuangia gilva TaxID=3057677 RepID=A0ABT8VU09_9FLAO|nr:cupin domain-containing protein [Wenyingzhuangia sp. chi5]MDO3695446.1 cupin domain-containing protein [Wenyingzhuangia sp. chi5]
MTKRAQLLIDQLELIQHPEGGYFKETHRSVGKIPQNSLPDLFNGDRNYYTSIYFLLTSDDFSAFHKINQEETWYFHEGAPIKIHQISPSGEYSFVMLGNNVLKGQQFQHTVPREYWFAATVEQKDSYSLVGCAVAPGFDFDDFTLAKRNELIALFPEHEKMITELTLS